MNYKAKIKKRGHKDKEPIEKSSPPIDLKQPIDMKVFWKQISQHTFAASADKTAHDIHHLVNLFSQHELKDDYIYAKAGFPRSLAQFADKAIDYSMNKNNTVLITKLLGLHVYVDNGDGADCLSDAGSSEKIKYEIRSLEKRMDYIEQNNLSNANRIKAIADDKDDAPTTGSKANAHKEKLNLQRYENLNDQIYRLQMKQFAESISGIKKDTKANRYVVQFDPSDQIESVNLSEEEYNTLIAFRDPFNSVSVHDLFQEKTFSYYNTNPQQQTQSSVKKKETIEIGRRVNINYKYCHHCKQRKPGEVIFQCKSHLNDGKTSSRPYKTFLINDTTVVRKRRSLIIKHFEGDPKEFIESSDKNEMPQECGRFFCHFCLKGSYDAKVDEVKGRKDWLCPHCTGVCFCSRCTRFDKILKLIGLYVSLGGEIADLYDDLIEKSVVLDKLNAHMLISNLVVVVNDPLLKPFQIMRRLASVEVKNTKKMDRVLTKYNLYKGNLGDIQSYYDKLLVQARVDKCLLTYDKMITEICLDNDNPLATFLRKKRNRIEKKKIINIAQVFLKKSKFSKRKKYKKRKSKDALEEEEENEKEREDEDEEENEEEEEEEENEEEEEEEENEEDEDEDEDKEEDEEDNDEPRPKQQKRKYKIKEKGRGQSKGRGRGRRKAEAKSQSKSKEKANIKAQTGANGEMPKRKRGRPRKNPEQ